MASLGKDAKRLAERYGIDYAFLRSDDSLWSTFQKAVKGNWTAEKFIAEVRNSDWYTKQSDSKRAADKLRLTNPAEWNRRLKQTIASLRDNAAAMGARTSAETLKDLATKALTNGWNESQIRDALSRSVKAYHGAYRGQAGDDVDAIESAAWKNGVRLSNNTLRAYAKRIAAGAMTVEDVQRGIRKQAVAMAPGYKDQLEAGLDLFDVASPYMDSMSKILEVNPADIDLFDPTVRGALSKKDKDGKVGTVTLSEFETQLRQDPRWLKTKNARDSLESAGRGILKDFGFSI